MLYNIGDVETCVPCFLGESVTFDAALCFGTRPKTSFFLNDYNKHHINAIVNIEEWKTDKKPWFYAKFLEKDKSTYHHIPLECAREEDDDCTSKAQDALIQSCVQRILEMLVRGRRVFIYGHVCNRLACVVALLVWARYTERTDVLSELQRGPLHDERALYEDFPATPQHKAQYERLLRGHRHTITASFERQCKKIKVNL